MHPSIVGKLGKARVIKISKSMLYHLSVKVIVERFFFFQEWNSADFVPNVKPHLTLFQLPLEAILVLDNAPSHPIDPFPTAINVLFQPPGVASLTKSMGQVVIIYVKWR